MREQTHTETERIAMKEQNGRKKERITTVGTLNGRFSVIVILRLNQSIIIKSFFKLLSLSVFVGM